MAMFQYEKTKEKPELDPVSDMAFCFIRSQMERDQQAYALRFFVGRLRRIMNTLPGIGTASGQKDKYKQRLTL